MYKPVVALILLFVGSSTGQINSRTAASKAETPHLSFVKEYVRELIEDESLTKTGEKKLSAANTPNEQFSTGIYLSKSAQLQLRSQIAMLKSMRLNGPFDTLIPTLITLYERQVDLHQTLMDISGKFLGGPKGGVDYQALAAKVPEIHAELDEARKALFDSSGLVFMTLIDPKPDSQNHVSHLLITKAEKADLEDELNILLKGEPDKGDHDYYISAGMVLRAGLQKGHKCADEAWE